MPEKSPNFTKNATMNANPYQGLKQSKGAHISRAVKATMNANPYQGLKPILEQGGGDSGGRQ